MLNGKAWHAKKPEGDLDMAYLSDPSCSVHGRTETKGIRAEKRKVLACPGTQSLLYLPHND